MCQRAALEAELVDRGQLTAERIANGQRVNLVRCGDVTDDENPDALFAVASGGTAGNTRFGVVEGREDGSPGALVLYKRGYEVGLARRNRRSFRSAAALRTADPNCCPSSFRLTRYSWFGNGFSVGKAKKLTDAPRGSTGPDAESSCPVRTSMRAEAAQPAPADMSLAAPSCVSPGGISRLSRSR